MLPTAADAPVLGLILNSDVVALPAPYSVPSEPKTSALPPAMPCGPMNEANAVASLIEYNLENDRPYNCPDVSNAMSVITTPMFPISVTAPVETSTVPSSPPLSCTYIIGDARAGDPLKHIPRTSALMVCFMTVPLCAHEIS